MDINTLEANLTKAIEGFKDEMQLNFKENSNAPATHSDLDEIARHAYYAMNDMKNEIIKYLKSN